MAPGTAPVNHAPVAGNDSFGTDEDTAFSGSVLGNDSDSDGNPLHTAVESKSTSGGGTVAIHDDGTFTYAPKADFNGTDSFTYTVTDGTGTANDSGLGTVTMTVAPVNDAPTLSVVTEETGAANGAVKITITYGDVDDTTLTAITSTPLHGGFASTVDGPIFTGNVVGSQTVDTEQGATPSVAYYIPDPNRPGTETLSFTLTDAAGASVTKTAVIEVVAPSEPVNQAPTLTVVTAPTGAANGAVKVTLTFAEPDEDLTTGYISTPLHGDLYADAAGTIPVPTGVSSPPFPGSSESTTQSVYYIPDPSRPGTETLSFTLTDDSGASVTKTAVIEVEAPSGPVNHAPTLTVVTAPTGAANGAVKVTLTFAEPDGDVVTSYIAGLEHGDLYADAGGFVRIPTGVTGTPAQLSSVPITQSAYYIPDPSRPGTETLSFTLTDASGASVTKTAFVEVAGLPSDPENHAPTVTVVRTDNADGTVILVVTVTDTDDDATNLFIGEREHGTLSVANQPIPDTFTGGPITPFTGTVTIPFTYTPDPGRPGVENLTFTVTDPSGETASYYSQVTVGAQTLSLGSAFAPVPNISFYDLAVIGNRIYVPTYDNTVAVIDRTTGQLIGTPVPFTDVPRSGFAVTPDGKLALITTDYEDEDHPENNGPQGVQIVNLQTGATTFIATDDGPQWVTVNETGTKAYVSNTFDGTVTVIDLTGATPTKLFDITGLSGPQAAVVVGNKIYVTSSDGESMRRLRREQCGCRTGGIPGGQPRMGSRRRTGRSLGRDRRQQHRRHRSQR